MAARKPRRKAVDASGAPVTAVVLDQSYELVPVGELTPHPDNPNQGDLGALMDSMAHKGMYGTLVAQRSTHYVLAGNHRLVAAANMGIEAVPVTWVDVDDETAARILAADNRIARLGVDDDAVLLDLLTQLAMTTDGLRGTGYDGDDLDAMIAAANAQPGENGGTKKKNYNVRIRCSSAEEQTNVLQQLLAAGFDAEVAR